MITIRTLLTTSLIFSLAIGNIAFAADRNHSDDSKGKKGQNNHQSREQHRGNDNRRDDKQASHNAVKHRINSTRHNNKHYNNKQRRHYSNNHRNHYPLGYFVGGAIIGSLLSHNSHSYHEREVIVPSARISYWRDSYGECFRIEERAGRESYISVSSQFCY